MSKTAIGILVAVVVVVGGYFAIKSSKSTDTSGAVVDTNEQATTAGANGKKMAFTEFAKQDGSYKCTVDQNVGDVTTSGTVYLDNGKMKGEFSSAAQGMNVDTSFVVRDGYTYTWSSALPNMGFKSKVNANTTAGSTAGSASGSYSFNGDQIGDYDCEVWKADVSLFALPSGVTFKEM